MTALRTDLETFETAGTIARRVFDRYGYDDSTADALLTAIQSVHGETTMTLGDLRRFIAKGIESGATEEVHAAAGANSVTVQTIHSVKGLEYPIVILANMNDGMFPSTGGQGSTISYSELTGLRQTKCYGEAHGVPHIYDNWRTDVLRYCQPTEHDEERRLLYVAMTRAKDHLLFAAGKEPNTFLEELPVDTETLEPKFEPADGPETIQSRLSVSIPEPDGPKGCSPHSLMDDEVYADVTEGRGIDFGSSVHDFAERYSLGEDVDPDSEYEDEQNVKALLNSLEGEFLVEEPAYLPLETDDGPITFSGIIDLVHVLPDRVEIIDYKTDRGRHAHEEYRTQLSVYYHALDDWFDDREVTASVYYTAADERVMIDPRTKVELLVRRKGVA